MTEHKFKYPITRKHKIRNERCSKNLSSLTAHVSSPSVGGQTHANDIAIKHGVGGTGRKVGAEVLEGRKLVKDLLAECSIYPPLPPPLGYATGTMATMASSRNMRWSEGAVVGGGWGRTSTLVPFGGEGAWGVKNSSEPVEKREAGGGEQATLSIRCMRWMRRASRQPISKPTLSSVGGAAGSRFSTTLTVVFLHDVRIIWGRDGGGLLPLKWNNFSLNVGIPFKG